MAEPNQLSLVIRVPSKFGVESHGGTGKREKMKFLKKQPGGVRCSYCGLIGFHRFKGRFVKCPRKAEILARGKEDSQDPIQNNDALTQVTAQSNAEASCPAEPHDIILGKCMLMCVSNSNSKWSDEMETGEEMKGEDEGDMASVTSGSEMSGEEEDEEMSDDELDTHKQQYEDEDEEIAQAQEETIKQKKAELDSSVERASIERTDGSLASWAGCNIFNMPIPLTHTESTPDSSPTRKHVVESGLFSRHDPRNHSPSPTPKPSAVPTGWLTSSNTTTPLSYASIPSIIKMKPVTPLLTNKNLPKDLDKTPTSPSVIKISKDQILSHRPIPNVFIGEDPTDIEEFHQQINYSKQATEEVDDLSFQREETPLNPTMFTASNEDVLKITSVLRDVGEIYGTKGPQRWTNPNKLLEPVMQFIFKMLSNDWASHNVMGSSINSTVYRAALHMEKKAENVCRAYGVDWDKTIESPEGIIIMKEKEVLEAREQIQFVKREAQKLAEMTEEEWLENHRRLEVEARKMFRDRVKGEYQMEKEASLRLGIVEGKVLIVGKVMSKEADEQDRKEKEGKMDVVKEEMVKVKENAKLIIHASPIKIGLPKPINYSRNYVAPMPYKDVKDVIEKGLEKKKMAVEKAKENEDLKDSKKNRTKNEPQEKKDGPKQKKLTFTQMAVATPTDPSKNSGKKPITPEMVQLAMEMKRMEPETPLEKFIEMLRLQAPSLEEKKPERVPFKVLQQ